MSDSRVVQVVTTRDLTDDESKRISSWVRGQNSDGLGEGFEQQWFSEGKFDPLDFGDDSYEDYEVASFDWGTNAYPLMRIE